jgi:hypothetical protein
MAMETNEDRPFSLEANTDENEQEQPHTPTEGSGHVAESIPEPQQHFRKVVGCFLKLYALQLMLFGLLALFVHVHPIVPLDVAREVIRVARLSAYAQLCELPEEQRANFQTFMRREEAKSKWTDQQMLFINQLHLFTVMTLTGKVALVEKDGDKQVVVQESRPLNPDRKSHQWPHAKILP